MEFSLFAFFFHLIVGWWNRAPSPSYFIDAAVILLPPIPSSEPVPTFVVRMRPNRSDMVERTRGNQCLSYEERAGWGSVTWFTINFSWRRASIARIGNVGLQTMRPSIHRLLHFVSSTHRFWFFQFHPKQSFHWHIEVNWFCWLCSDKVHLLDDFLTMCQTSTGTITIRTRCHWFHSQKSSADVDDYAWSKSVSFSIERRDIVKRCIRPPKFLIG
jgi:hypothetical protein